MDHEGELVVIARNLAAVVNHTVKHGGDLTPVDLVPLPGEVAPDVQELPHLNCHLHTHLVLVAPSRGLEPPTLVTT